ncbi:MAG: hypothetical protein OXS33_12245 [bacterium]|nr:hypothetical protein [bacterium]MDE0500512.1 hypothetical protein [bacterium]
MKNPGILSSDTGVKNTDLRWRINPLNLPATSGLGPRAEIGFVFPEL